MIGIKDVDRIIFDKLSNKDILQVYKINKYTYNKVCDETFFRNLVFERYPGTVKYKHYVKDSWKRYFINNIYYLDKLTKENCSCGSDMCSQLEYCSSGSDLCPELEYLARKLRRMCYIEYNKEELLKLQNLDFSLSFAKYIIRQNLHIKNEAIKVAIMNNHLPVIEYLSEQCNNNSIYIDHLFIFASQIGNLEMVKYFAQQGANIWRFNHEALRIASFNGYLPVVKYLVENGADVNAFDNEPLRNAILKSHFSIVKYLEENGDDIYTKAADTLNLASTLGQFPIVKYVVENGVGIEKGVDKKTLNRALKNAWDNKHVDIVKYLQKNGADINVLKGNVELILRDTNKNNFNTLIRGLGFTFGFVLGCTLVNFVLSHK